MMSTSSLQRTARSNFWIDNHITRHGPWKSFPNLTTSTKERFDVAVIGAGWFGLHTALKLHEQGKKVIVLEGGEIGTSSVASWSTAKVTSQHRVKYSTIASKFNQHLADQYAKMNEEAINDVERIIQKYDIHCQWTRASHIVFAQDEKESKTLKEELNHAKQSGLMVSWLDATSDLPKSVQVTGAIKTDNQAHMNPVSYLLRIAQILHDSGVQIFQNSRVDHVSYTAPHEISAAGCKVEADHVVLATHLPILNRTGHFATVSPSRSYCIAVTLKDPQNMIRETYINVDKEHTISLRPADEGKILIVSGAGHPVGEYSGDWGYSPLIEWTKRHFLVDEVISRWSAMDYYPADELPYMGYAMHGYKSLFTATGFSKWGFTQGVAAAQIVTDLIMHKKNPYMKSFDARRWDIAHSAMSEISIQAHVAKHFIGDRLTTKSVDIEDLALGCGGVFKDKISGEKVAVYKDTDGCTRKFSPVCTHLGCYVQWNSEDKIFECPCHGSVYNTSGELIHGPATSPLKKIDNGKL